ncbi:MAG: hypothetical protein EWV50_07530 [Microcystis aeruginosa Ma_MB_F_20061100_S20]|uniref:Uncharacterized protein n=1 Tax=Microcystis aeruginosa Ma_MB_F_20061100_S20D TaxID=2486253 RepID=A0A552EKH0_MICAE|nr:MAG: hypothetical protein EWV78_12105 [Microcystis aeruginosa Ma_MB_F_20061100_S20D]TRU40790.1 MAG: hypothetical protein EWV50_07530 [Microcystis aeruginosa Ma_MB_F_20061100_S20]
MKQPVAIIGIGCRFPQASNPSEFWCVLRDGVNTITKAPVNHPTKMTGWGGFLNGIDQFDAEFFGISSEEAIKIDPQHRLLLETSWEALEDAGLVPANLAGINAGVFIGISGNEYQNLLSEDPTFYSTLGTLECMLANRISSYFDFRGLSLTINASCSSVLVAIDYACQRLWNGEISLALVGGINLTFFPVIASRFANASLISADGLCKIFDANADGYVRGEGVGVVILKPLSQAQADGDRIYAVIRGSGINHNGSGNGLTAPNMQAQIDLLQKVYQRSEINPNSINYIEAQGTATPIGDALEMKALGAVVGKDRTADNPCRVGCVKTNIGHTEGASGIAGLIKVALSLYHRQIPPTLNCQEPNPAIPFAKLGLKVQQTLETLPEETGVIRAGVSSFALGGTNAHVILESVPSQAKAEPNLSPLQIFTLTAKTSTALQALVQRYQAFLEDQPQASLVDICFMANTRRSQFSHRLAMITESKEQLKEQLNMIVRQEALSSVFSGQVTRKKSAPICFIFSGTSQKMKQIIKSLAHSHPAIYSLLEELQPLISSHSKRSFLELIEEEDLENSLLSQVVNFIGEYAMTQLWRYWGIEPAMCIGYGLGNYAALVSAGILTVEEAISLIIEDEDKNFESPPKFQAAKIPVILPLSGKTIKIHETIDYKQWQKEFNVNNMNAENLPSLLSDSNVILLDLCSLEIKSHDYLKQLDDYNIKSPEEIKSFYHLHCLFSTLIKFWLMGVKIDWSKVANYQQCYPISVPTYPFEGQSYWIDVSPKIPNKQSSHNQENYFNGQSSHNQENYFNVEFIAPRDNLEMQLTEIWQEVLGIQTIGVKDNFFNLGGRSLVAVKLFAQIEKVFKINLPLVTLFQAPTVEQIARILREKAVETDPQTHSLRLESQLNPQFSLVAMQSGGAKRPFFLVPGGGGGENELIIYAKLVYLLGEERPVYGFQARGWDGIENPHNTVEAMATDYIKEIRTVQPEGPYLLGGECIGGLVALEMAQQLVAQGQKVGLLVFLDTPVPTLPRKLRYHTERFFQIPRIRYHLRELQFSAKGESLTYIFNQASKVKEKLAEDSFSRHRKKVAKNYIKIIMHYRPQTYSGGITWLVTESFYPKAQNQGWNHLAGGGLEIHRLPGTHDSYLGDNVETTAERLKACLDEAQADD